MNSLSVIGNLTRDPELRHTPEGTAVCDFGLAINEFHKRKGSNETQKSVVFVDITAWARQAESCSEYLRKGAKVAVEGKLKYDTWERDGIKRSKLSIVANRVHFLSPRPRRDESRPEERPESKPEEKSETPF